MKNVLMAITGIFLWISCVQHSHDRIINRDLNVSLEETLEYLNDRSGTNRKNPDLYYQRAKVFYIYKEYQQALEDITKAIDIQTASPEYHLLKGKVEYELDKYAESIQSLLIAEKLGVRDQKLYEILSQEYLILGEIDKAKAAIDRLIILQPDGSSYTLKARIMLEAKDTALAKLSYEKAIAIEKSYKNAYIGLTDLYRTMKDLDRAREIAGKYLALKPLDEDMLLKEGQLLEYQEQYDSAGQVYGKVLTLDSLVYEGHFGLAKILLYLGDYDSAYTVAERAFSLNPMFFEARHVAAQALDKQQKFSEAITMYELILEHDSTDNLAQAELNNLKRKVAYLWELGQRRRAKDSARLNEPPTLEKKRIDN